MRYLIDGYNLLFGLGLVTGRAAAHGLEKARLALLSRLCEDHPPDGAGVTVVFDAAGAPPGAAAEVDHHAVHVCYALDGEADDVIEELIRRETAPGQLTVVSDDHRLQAAARRRRCVVLGCMEYLDERERQRRHRSPPPEAPAKPEGVSAEEADHWKREFADLIDDPAVREALGPDFEGEGGE